LIALLPKILVDESILSIIVPVFIVVIK